MAVEKIAGRQRSSEQLEASCRAEDAITAARGVSRH